MTHCVPCNVFDELLKSALAAYAGAGANQTRKLSEAYPESCVEPNSVKPYEAMCLLGEVTHRVLQELFALLVGRALVEGCFENFCICSNHLCATGDSGFAPPRIRILS